MHMNLIDISQKILRRKKWLPFKCKFFSWDITYPQNDQNEVSGKSAKNDPTSQQHNFFENGRTRLLYDSFWSQGLPKLKKIGLGWFPQTTRPPRADSRFSDFFSGISRRAADPISKEKVFATLWNLRSPFFYIILGAPRSNKNHPKIRDLGFQSVVKTF
jgi:hypothetical protein